jgi:hypothetical protein
MEKYSADWRQCISTRLPPAPGGCLGVAVHNTSGIEIFPIGERTAQIGTTSSCLG